MRKLATEADAGDGPDVTQNLDASILTALGVIALDKNVPARDRIAAAKAYLDAKTVDKIPRGDVAGTDPGTYSLEELNAMLSKA